MGPFAPSKDEVEGTPVMQRMKEGLAARGTGRDLPPCCHASMTEAVASEVWDGFSILASLSGPKNKWGPQKA